MCEILRTAPAGSRGWVAQVEGPPTADDPDWGGHSIDPIAQPLHVNGHNAYFSVAAFPVGAKRKTAEATGVAVIVCDDVGTKAKSDRLVDTLGPPSYRIETSPGNEQWGYLLTRLATIDETTAIYKGLIARQLTDRDGMTPVRYARLPAGTNNKPEYGEPFKVRAREWSPQRRFDPNALLTALDQKPTNPHPSPSRLSKPAADELRSALAALPNDFSRSDWVAIGHALKHELGDKGLSDWIDFSRKWAEYDEGDTRSRWDGFKPNGKRTAATIYALAKKHGWSSDAGQDRLIIERLSDIPVEIIVPLWPGRFFLGKTSIIAGNMGLGKSTLVFDIAARVTVGADWPDGSGKAPIGDVLILSTEDGAADTIRPRIEVMGGDVRRVHVIQGVESTNAQTNKSSRRLFSLTSHMDLLRRAFREMGGKIRLVIIDPITGVFHGTDTHKTADVREVMGALKEVCEEAHAAFIGISHPNKAQGQSAVYRITGSLAFAAAPRSAFIVGTNPENEDQVVFAELKNNLGPRQPSLGFHLVGRTHPVAGSIPAVEWLGVVEGRPDDILDPSSGSRTRGVQERTDVTASWLRDLLAGGPIETKRVKAMAREEGFSERMLRAAEESLGTRTRKQGFGKDSKWVIFLPQREVI